MRKTSLYLALVALIISTTLGAQSKSPLSIREAVMEARSTFAPERISGLQWIPDSDDYSYSSLSEEGEPQIMRGRVIGGADAVLFSLTGMRSSFEVAGYVPPDDIPYFEWMSTDHLLFHYKGQYWDYQVSTQKVIKKVSGTYFQAGHQFSPDFSHSASLIGSDIGISNYDIDTLRITSNEEGHVSGDAVSRYEFGISKGLFWSNNSKRLAYYQKDESQVTEYDLIDYSPVPAAPAPIRYPMAGQLSEHIDVMVYDLQSQEHLALDVAGPSDQYITSVTWSLDDKQLLLGVLDRSQNNFELRNYDALTGKYLSTLFTEQSDKYVEPEQAPYMLPGTKGEFIWFSERDGYNHAYRYSAKGKLLNQVTTGNKVMHIIKHYDAERQELWISGTDEAIETVLYRVGIKGGKLTRVTKEKGTHITKVNDQGTYIIDEFTALDTPRETRLLKRDGTVLRVLKKSPNPLADRAVGSTEIFTIKADDGTDLYARMIKPSGFDEEKKYPVLIYVYNGPHVQLVTNSWMAGASLWMHSLAEMGYLVFTVDGRGSLDRGRDFEQAVHNRLGELETADQMAGVRYLKSLPYVDENKLAVHGWSFGGYMTLNLLLRHPDVFQAGVAGGAVTDWRFYEVMYTERYMDEPKDNEEGYDNTRLAPLASELKADLLMVHGTNDDVVVPQHCMVMLNAFINADKQVDLFLYPGHGHNVRGEDRVHLMTKVINYIDARIGESSE